MATNARARAGTRRTWRTYVTWAVFAVVIWYILKLYAGISLATKMMACLEGEQVEGASEAEIEAIGRRAVACLDARVNVIERIWYDRDEVLVNGRTLDAG
jgi:hypothetical protein